jgi:hypothetical protein
LRKVKVFQIIEAGGGAAKQVSYICNNLNKDKFDVHLIYSLRSDSPNYQESLREITLHFIPMTREISPLKDVLAFYKMLRLIRKERPNVIHTHSSKAGFLGRLVAYITGVPLILYSPRGFAFLRQDVSSFKRKFYYYLEKLASIWTDKIIAVSGTEADCAIDLASVDKAELIENAVDISEIDEFVSLSENRCRSSIKKIVTVGRVSPQKNPIFFLNVAIKLLTKYPNLLFMWIGDGQLRDKFQCWIKDYNLGNSIKITGWLERKTVYELLGQSDIFVMASLWEGLPNSILEAMAMKKPVVATNIMGNKDAVIHRETGFLADTLEEFAECVSLLIENDDLSLQMGEKARKIVEERFTISKMIKKLEELYLR